MSQTEMANTDTQILTHKPKKKKQINADSRHQLCSGQKFINDEIL